MNLFKLTISSLVLVTSSINVGMTQESEYPLGVKINDLGEIETTKALVDLEAGSGGTSIRYASFSASGMNNRNNADANYSGGGCMNFNTTGWLDASVDLPEGSRIVSISYLVEDNSATGQASGETLAVNGDGGFTSVLNTLDTDLSGTPGDINIGGFVDYTLDGFEGLSVRLSASSSTDTEVCGVRVGYVAPSVASEVIFVSNFFR